MVNCKLCGTKNNDINTFCTKCKAPLIINEIDRISKFLFEFVKISTDRIISKQAKPFPVELTVAIKRNPNELYCCFYFCLVHTCLEYMRNSDTADKIIEKITEHIMQYNNIAKIYADRFREYAMLIKDKNNSKVWGAMYTHLTNNIEPDVIEVFKVSLNFSLTIKDIMYILVIINEKMNIAIIDKKTKNAILKMLKEKGWLKCISCNNEFKYNDNICSYCGCELFYSFIVV